MSSLRVLYSAIQLLPTIYNITMIMQVTSRLKMMLRSIRALNTTVGKTSLVFAVICAPSDIAGIGEILKDCGAADKREIGFIHMNDCKKGI